MPAPRPASPYPFRAIVVPCALALGTLAPVAMGLAVPTAVAEAAVLTPGQDVRSPADGSGLRAGSDAGAAPAATGTVGPTSPAGGSTTTKYFVVQAAAQDGPDTLFKIAERFLGSGDRAQEIFELNRGRQEPGNRQFTDPAVIFPGWVIELPADAKGDGVQTGPLPAIGAAPSDSGPTSQATTLSTSGTSDAAQSFPLVAIVAIAVLAVGAAAGGAWWFLARRRDVAVSEGGRADGRTDTPARRRPRSKFTLPWRRRGVSTDTPRREDPGVWTIDRAARAVATACAALGRGAPNVYAVVVGDDSVRLRLTGPDPDAPTGWTVSEGGRTWSSALRVLQSSPVDDGVAMPFPHLVSLGDVADGRVLLDLARAQGVISLEGDSSMARALADRWVREFATNPWSGEVVVLRVGRTYAGEVLAGTAVEDLAAAEPLLAGASGVLIVSDLGRGEAGRIEDLAGDPDRRWVVVLVDAGGSDARWRLTIDGSGQIVGGPLDGPVRAGHLLEDVKPA